MGYLSRRKFMVMLGLSGASASAVATQESVSGKKEEEFIDWTVGPYLQNPATDAITICFVSDYASDVVFKIQKASGGRAISKPATPSRIPGTAATVWKARITALEEAGTYRYRVAYTAGGRKVAGKIYNFKTLSSTSPASCIVVNDIHNRIGTVEALMKHVKPDDYEFSIILGDLWDYPSWKKKGKSVMGVLAGVIKHLNGHEKPMLFARGNHDWRGWFSSRIAHLFDWPGLDPAQSAYKQKFYYSLAVGPAFFIFNDCGEDGNKREKQFAPYRAAQSEWLTKVLKTPEYAQAAFHIHVCHIPLYNYKWLSRYCYKLWSPILTADKIDLAIAGHDHQWKVLEKDRKCTNKDCPNFGKSKGGACYHSPPYKEVIGGGPHMNQGTVMLLRADNKRLSVKMLNASGKVLVDCAVDPRAAG